MSIFTAKHHGNAFDTRSFFYLPMAAELQSFRGVHFLLSFLYTTNCAALRKKCILHRKCISERASQKEREWLCDWRSKRKSYDLFIVSSRMNCVFLMAHTLDPGVKAKTSRPKNIPYNTHTTNTIGWIYSIDKWAANKIYIVLLHVYFSIAFYSCIVQISVRCWPFVTLCRTISTFVFYVLSAFENSDQGNRHKYTVIFCPA